MKILVCISKVPDTTAKISFTSDNTAFNEEGVQFILNPADEWYALVKALEIKEAKGGEVHLVSVGKSDYDAVIRKALALDADQAFRIDAEGTDAYFTASQIAHFAKGKDYDLILTGKETINHNSGSVGGMLAAMLDLTYVPLATHMELTDSEVTLNREIEGGEEICTTKTPLVVSCMKGMAEQRIPNVRGIMAARKKPLEVVDPISVDPLTTVKKFEVPEKKEGIKMIDADKPEELVRLLHEEAKVI